jgi:hypothetical protein
MPRGNEEEIAVRDEEFFRFVALLATRALLEWPTLNPSLIRHQLGLMASVASNRPALMRELRLGLRTYANLIADARIQSSRPVKRRLGAEASDRPLLRPIVGSRFLTIARSPQPRPRQAGPSLLQACHSLENCFRIDFTIVGRPRDELIRSHKH